MAKKSPSPTTKTEAKDGRTGVDKIIDYLQKNRQSIGAIVVGVAAKPTKKLVSKDGNDCDAIFHTADLITANDDEERGSDVIRSMVTQGIANSIAQRVLLERRGFFG